MSTANLRRYVMPGIAFQAVVIGGGYGTGREIVEFFLRQGTVAGLASMALATVIFSVVCVVSYEFARYYQVFHYQAFFRQLIGGAAFLFEVAWFVFMLIVLSVVTAAVGEIFREAFGLPFWAGVASLAVVTLALVYAGTQAIKKAFELWTIVLVTVFALALLWAFLQLGPSIREAFTDPAMRVNQAPPRHWLVAGIAYAGYNLSLIPALLYTIETEVATRRDAVIAGVLAGPIAMIPALMFFVAMSGLYPQILPEAVPSNALLAALGFRPLQLAFQVVLIGTLIATSVGMVQSVNARLGFASGADSRHRSADDRGDESNVARSDRRRGATASTLVALAWMLLAAFFAQFGLIGLIARGYGTVTWVFVGVYVVPVLTIGVWKVTKAGASLSSEGPGSSPV